jgi:hypothetical protein
LEDPHPGCPAATPAVRELKLTTPDAGWLTGPGGFAGDLQIAFFRIEFQPPPAH